MSGGELGCCFPQNVPFVPNGFLWFPFYWWELSCVQRLQRDRIFLWVERGAAFAQASCWGAGTVASGFIWVIYGRSISVLPSPPHVIQPNEAHQALKKETRPICDIVLKREKVEVSPVTQVLSPTSASILWRLGRTGDRRCADDPSWTRMWCRKPPCWGRTACSRGPWIEVLPRARNIVVERRTLSLPLWRTGKHPTRTSAMKEIKQGDVIESDGGRGLLSTGWSWKA